MTDELSCGGYGRRDSGTVEGVVEEALEELE